MPNAADHAVMQAVGDRLIDTAELYASAAKVADQPALKSRLEETAHDRMHMARELLAQIGVTGHEMEASGSLLTLLDHLRLKIDQWTGGNDDAALSNVRQEDQELANMIHGHMRDPEITQAMGALLAKVASCLPPPSEDTGLKGLATL